MLKLTATILAACFIGSMACNGNVTDDSPDENPNGDSECPALDESACLDTASCSAIYGEAQDGSPVFGHCAERDASCDSALACHQDPSTGAEVQFSDLCDFDWPFVSSVCSWGAAGTGGQAGSGGAGTGGQSGIGGDSGSGGAGTGGDATGGADGSDVPPDQVGHVAQSCGAFSGTDMDPTIVDCTEEGDEQAICVFSNHCLCSEGFACGTPDGFLGECTQGVICVPVE